MNQTLKATSRSFYLTMRVLPCAIRPQISLAYLLARATDTIADTEIISVKRRLEALEKLRARILGTSQAGLNFGELASPQANPAEKILLERSEEALALLNRFSPEDQKHIRDVLNTITSGQELDLQRFAGANEHLVIALQDESELDDYTYRVAGCVGEFWTRMCRTHLFPGAKLNDALLMANGIRFGKGLQLVNILRDLPRDLRMGRCYIPQDELNFAGLMPHDLLAMANEEKFRPVYEKFLDQAQRHLAAGWAYTKSLPRNQPRVRLACAWPILIGARTLQKLRSENILDASRRVKVGRAEIRNLIAKSILLYPFSSKWDLQFTEAVDFRNAVDSKSSFHY
ncbi:MAG: phytoene/squalene synthase family protein [Verrucomicrobiota bacterium]